MDAWTAAAGWVVAIVLGALWALDHRTQARLLTQYRISREYWRVVANRNARREAARVVASSSGQFDTAGNATSSND